MDNKILFEETFKTFDEKRQKLSYDKWSQWDEEEVTTLMYDVAITARDVVLNALLEKLKSLLTEEQLKSVLDVIPELFSKKPETKPGIDKETIKQVITLYRQWQDELSDVPLVNYIQERLVSTKEGKKKFEGKKLRECNLSARAINCLYMSNVFTSVPSLLVIFPASPKISNSSGLYDDMNDCGTLIGS